MQLNGVDHACFDLYKLVLLFAEWDHVGCRRYREATGALKLRVSDQVKEDKQLARAGALQHWGGVSSLIGGGLGSGWTDGEEEEELTGFKKLFSKCFGKKKEGGDDDESDVSDESDLSDDDDSTVRSSITGSGRGKRCVLFDPSACPARVLDPIPEHTYRGLPSCCLGYRAPCRDREKKGGRLPELPLDLTRVGSPTTCIGHACCSSSKN